MPSLNIVETVSPDFVVEREMLEPISAEWFAGNREARQRYLRFAANAGVEKRHFIMPYETVLTFNGLQGRAELFEEHGTALMQQALQQTLSRFDGSAHDFSHLIFTSCSVPAIPSIDAGVIMNSPLSPSISRVPIFQHGCAGGVAGLSLGAKLAGLGAPVLLSSVELCSLVFHPENHTAEQLVGAAIFGDGAAMAVISPEPGVMNIVDSMSILVPNTRHLMGYSLLDDGFYLRLDRGLPATLADFAPGVIQSFLGKHGLTTEAIDFWLPHPGGRKILDFFSERFNLKDTQCRWSREVLSERGNLSSATILFVLKKFLDSDVLTKGRRALVLGIGPGLTIELILVEG